MNKLLRLKSLRLLLLALAWFALAPLAYAGRPPNREDRGNGNSAGDGIQTLNLATTGTGNTAHGWFSLLGNTSGSFNTADGFAALFSNTTGNVNTATGVHALFHNTTGSNNTANGVNALFNNTTGNNNTTNGVQALYFNTTGYNNTANGVNALFNNTTGTSNTANGAFALLSNTTGSSNTVLGSLAGSSVTTASNVTCIGAFVGGADVNNTTWIGNVYGVTAQSGTTAPVIVSDTGQLGTVASSERFKKDIATMDKASEAILSFRPVTFHYRSDAKETPQFGLIAEEVAKVNPALVLSDKEGKLYTVRYDAVNAMLLNEFLKEHHQVQDLKAIVAAQQRQIEALTAGLQKVSAEIEMSRAAPQMVGNNR